ncbi:uncharacterized protein LOC105285967 [Ooceraea biroi]|uniref:uncharacterized protein LOC105285967 n=1 Tax=Ooceraea biroi TaxID=2015173 RepID=UPI0005BA9007|nr:uncharacterized protein LOC105285967 [Ooceraea biroi]
MPDAMVHLQGYQLFRRDHVGKIGGGVAIFLESSLHAKVLKCSDEVYNSRPEYLIAEISVADASRLLLAVVYRPPHCGYLGEFFEAFSDLSLQYKHAIIFGDFNADLNASTYDSRQIFDFAECYNLYLVLYNNTHHTRESARRLDLCLVDDGGKVVHFGQHDISWLSAHDLIHIKYQIRIERQRRRKIYVRDFRSLDTARLLRDLDSIDWSEMFETDNIDTKVEIFNKLTLATFDRHAPERLIEVRGLPAPWMSSELKRRMLRETEPEEDGGNAEDQREVWSGLRHLGLVKARPVDRSLDFTLEELNNYFVRDAGFDSDRIYLGEPEYGDEKFYFRHVGLEEVSAAVLRNKSPATGVDGLSGRLVRIALPSVLPVLSHIFNWSLMCGTFPSVWKAALVVPLPKTKSPSLLQHFRPISILCNVSKAPERLVADQIIKYLDSKNLFDIHQLAYRKGHSTQTALIRVLDDIRCAVDRRQITVSVFFDFSKAFDCVSHRILIDKLKSLHLPNSVLRWISSYLDGRSQAVREPNERATSSFIDVHVGVPQGSVLGTLLFLLFLSDFGGILRYCKYGFYADDLMIYLHCDPKELADAVRRINEDIKRITDWAASNKLRLNASKTKAMLMGTARYINAIPIDTAPRILVLDDVIAYSKSVTYLGLTISNNLSWDRQVNAVVGRVNSVVYELKLCKDCCRIA